MLAGLAMAMAVVAALAGCGGGGGGANPPDREVSRSTAPAERFEFEIADGRASPPLDRATVARGSTVQIVVTSDQPDELHLHGYDLTVRVGPGEPGSVEFTADQTGLFELEVHDAGLVLLQLIVE